MREIHSSQTRNVNVLPAIQLDIAKSPSPIMDKFHESFDYLYCANMIHISSNAAVDGLFINGSKMLKSKGILFIYGPFR